jgi:hypothetical protein
MKIQHLIPILFLAAFCTVSAQTNNSEAFRSNRIRDYFAPIHAHQAEMSLACGATMTNILKDIVKIAPEYPQLSETGTISIETFGSPTAPSYMLIYRKNAQSVRTTSPEPQESPTNILFHSGLFPVFDVRSPIRTLPVPEAQAASRMEVNSGGIDLTISLEDSENTSRDKLVHCNIDF